MKSVMLDQLRVSKAGGLYAVTARLNRAQLTPLGVVIASAIEAGPGGATLTVWEGTTRVRQGRRRYVRLPHLMVQTRRR